MNVGRALADRAVVLLLGVAVGTGIGWAYGVSSGTHAPAPGVSHAVVMPRDAPVALADSAAARQCPGVWANVRESVAQNRPVRVGVFGDSYGEGVFAALDQQLPRRDGFDVLKYTHLSTGFTRYRSLDLEKDAGEQLGSAPLDVAVVTFGANDNQPIFTAKRRYADLMSAEWQEEIGPRVDRFVGVLRAHHAMVYWVGLPAMREPQTDAGIGAVNAFYARRMAALGVPFFDSRALVAGRDGGFAEYLPDPKTGKDVQMRLGDGVHMTFQGYSVITKAVAGRIHGYVADARGAGPGSR